MKEFPKNQELVNNPLTTRLKMIRLIYMNETNITPRQKFILNLINQSNGLLRKQIQRKIEISYKVSKPTLIRDLNKLVSIKLVRIDGKGKNTKYFPFSKNPLLKPFDIDQYFQLGPDERVGAKKTFNFDIFKNLKDLFNASELEEIEKAKKSFTKQTQKLNSNVLKRELERFVIELSWKSSKIEGNTYSLLETETLIKEAKEAEGKSKEESAMILNHKEAFEQILKNKEDFKRISISLINQLHNIIAANLDILPGIRKQAVGITGTVYRPSDNQHQITEAMEKLVHVLNSNLSALEKALVANSMISYIQPYSDGNKRTGRMLTNAILLVNDYYPLSYRSINEDEFKKALILFYEQRSIYHLKRLFIEQLLFAFDTYFN